MTSKTTNPTKTMKSLIQTIAGISFGTMIATGQQGTEFTNYFVQIGMPSDGYPGTQEIVYVSDEGEQMSPLEINPGGARFELWTVMNNPLTQFLLDHKYVSADTPIAEVVIVSEDPYTVIPRTRADRPFDVWVKTDGIHNHEDAAASLRAVRLMRHVQSYGIDGTGDHIDRNQASLLQEVFLDDSQTYHFSFPVTAIPGEDRTKVRGEERFSVFSIADTQSPSSQLASMYVQVWPVANGSISGITNGETLRFNTPQVTFTYEDLYPSSISFAYIYPGPATPGDSLNLDAKVILGSGPGPRYQGTPFDDTQVLNNWDIHIDQDGEWTIELRTQTPFGIDRLAYVTFNINRSIEVQGSVTTSE